MNRVFMVLCVISCVTFMGCATIVHGSKQDIRVISKPSGAVVRVGSMATTTPGVLTLDRKYVAYALIFEKEGYKPIEVTLERKLDGWLFGNIIYGGIIGLIIDFSNGAAYRLAPSEVDVVFGETGASSRVSKKGAVIVFVDMEHVKSLGITPTERII